MSAPYCTGPCFIYAGIASNLSSLAISTKTTTRSLPPVPPSPGPVIIGGQQLQELQNGVPGPGLDPAINAFLAASLTSVKTTVLATAFRTVTPLYLGTCEDSPVPDFLPAYIPVPLEESGQTYGADYLYDGQEATIAATLTEWNENVHALLRTHAGQGILNTAAPGGIDLDGHIGTLTGTEGANAPVWLVFPYSQKDWQAQGGLPPCYRFFSCRLLSHGLRDLSTKPKKIQMIWRAQRLVIPGLGAFLYDHDPSGLPNPD